MELASQLHMNTPAEPSVELRLAGTMRDARRFACDIRRFAEAHSGCGDHPQLARYDDLAQRRRILDPLYRSTLMSIITSLDRRIARHADASAPTGAVTGTPPPVTPARIDNALSLSALRARAVGLIDAIDDVLDTILAEEAVKEARFYPFFDPPTTSVTPRNSMTETEPLYGQTDSRPEIHVPNQ